MTIGETVEAPRQAAGPAGGVEAEALLGPGEVVATVVVLLACVTLHPFESLGTSASIELSSGAATTTYAAFALLAALGVALVRPQLALAARALLPWPFVALYGWLGLSCLVSADPVTSLKRLVLAGIMAVLGASLVLLPRTPRALALVLAVSAGAVLVLSYGGVMLVPDLAIHQITDMGEPDLAGDWRGVFAHKNGAAGVMSVFVFLGLFVGDWRGVFAHKNGAAGVMSVFVFLGLFVSACGLAPLGWAIVAGAAVFLLFAGGKSALALVVVTLLVSRAWTALPDRWPRVAIALAPVVALNLVGVGSVLLPPVGALVHALPIDSSFTGRDDIWAFAVDAMPGHLVLGHGFDGFWNTEATRYGGDDATWAGTAAHAHNSFLDMVVSAGLPGLGLMLLAFLRQPLRDLRDAQRHGTDPALLALFLRIWLFGLYLSAFETKFFFRDDPVWLFFLFGLAGLRLAATFRLKRNEAPA